MVYDKKDMKVNTEDNDSLVNVVSSHIDDSLGFIATDTQLERAAALEYYLTEPYGNEVEGRSQIVTGEVVDIIYQVFPIEKFGDPNWVKDYRKKADHFAKMVIDTILRNTILADKMISYLAKSEKIPELNAIQRLEELTPLAKIVLGAKPKPIEATDEEEEEDDASIEIPDGAKPGPIDVEYKSKMKPSAVYEAAEHTIKTWGRKGTSNGIMGIWGEFVSVDYDICVADGGCIEACPVGVYEWFDSPGNPASDQKPLMSKEPDCIFCLACEGVCPPQAIKIYEQK